MLMKDTVNIYFYSWEYLLLFVGDAFYCTNFVDFPIVRGNVVIYLFTNSKGG